MDEKSADLIRLTIERDLERMRGELTSAKAELEAVKMELVQQVADAKVQIGDQSIEKMYKVFTEFRAWALLCFALLVSVGGFSFYQLYTGARQIIESKITDWLSLEKKGALLKESLESIRMRVVLDSYITRLARANLSGTYRNQLDLSAAEKSRLVAYMLEPETSDIDFRDGARAISANIGYFYSGVDTHIDELLAKGMTSFQVESIRPRILLETLKHYPGIGGYAEGILKNSNMPDDLREYAFLALVESFRRDAQKYAMGHILSEQSGSLQNAEALSLVGEERAEGLIDQWLAKKSVKGEEVDAKVMLADNLSSQSSAISIDESHQKWISNRTAYLLISAISKGAKLDFDDNFFPRVTLGFRADTTTGLRRPEQLFEDNKALMAAMARAAAMTHLPAEVFIKALTTKGTRGEVFGLRVILNSAIFFGETFGEIDAEKIAGPILLVAEDKSPGSSIQISFRAKDGRWITDRVKSINNFYNANISFAYDKAVLQMARSQNSHEFDVIN